MKMDRVAKITRIVVIGAIAVVLLWDLYAQIKVGIKGTVSWQLWVWSGKFPFVTFLTGFVCGHIFWGDPRTMK